MFIGEYGKFVWLTYLGTAFSLLGIYFLLQGQIRLSMASWIGAGICDLFDGRVARMTKRTKMQEEFGFEIDSLSDMISFAAFPAVLVMTQSPFSPWITLPVVIIYVLACITRLAYFKRIEREQMNQTNEAAASSAYFIGLPVTYAALVFPIGFVITQWIYPALFQYYVILCAMIMSCLHILNRRFPKPGIRAYIFFVMLAIGTLLSLWWL